MKKAVVLFSGGLDSTTLIYHARGKGFKVYCLIFNYGQRHKVEVEKARALVKKLKCEFKEVCFNLPWQGSSLLDKKIKLPSNKNVNSKIIPSTYVPARNIIFLSFAASYAEALGAGSVFIGANAVDYSGYPDCRPEFFSAYQETIKRGLKTGVQGKTIKIHAPLLYKTKAQIIKMGAALAVPYELTWSCYKGGRRPCRECDSCLLREKGFNEAGVEDPLIFRRKK